MDSPRALPVRALNKDAVGSVCEERQGQQQAARLADSAIPTMEVISAPVLADVVASSKALTGQRRGA